MSALRTVEAAERVRALAIVLKEDDYYVAIEPITNVASQGKSIEEALENLKEALELYLEEDREMLEYLREVKLVGAMDLEAAPRTRS